MHFNSPHFSISIHIERNYLLQRDSILHCKHFLNFPGCFSILQGNYYIIKIQVIYTVQFIKYPPPISLYFGKRVHITYDFMFFSYFFQQYLIPFQFHITKSSNWLFSVFQNIPYLSPRISNYCKFLPIYSIPYMS